MALIRKWYLFHEFNKVFSQTGFFHGYRLYAVDDSDIHIPTNLDDKKTFFGAADNAKDYNLIHLNALYDLLNRRFIEAVLQDRRDENENNALINMLENVAHDTIIVTDRGYESYHNIANLEAQGLKYVIRVRSKYGISDKFNINPDEETDFTADILLTRKRTKEIKANPGKYRFLVKNSTFDFLPQGSEDAYPLKFRIIRIKISKGQYETIVTKACLYKMNVWIFEHNFDGYKTKK